ncbi:MAG: FIST C-terminal domain-containing protein [SAR324 cluster bacterium]|nr:FIST C-terminal domain-containing protein [SAR324 cluster bacterium]
MSDIKVGVGLSLASDSALAARQASLEALEQAGLKSATWALCFFSGHHLPGAEALRATILRETGCTSLGGCSAMGVIAKGEEVEGVPAVALMVGGASGVEAHSVLLPEDGQGLAGFGNLSGWSSGNSLLLVLPDTFQVDINQVRNRMCSEIPELPVFGAGATDDGRTGISLQLGMEGVRNRSISLLGLFGELEVAVGITQSCKLLGEPHFITNSRENILIELDGQPALGKLIQQGQALGLDDFQQLSMEVMFGFPLDTENPQFTGETCLVRSLGGLDQDSHGLVVPYPLINQTSMAFMHRNPKTAQQDMRRMVKEVQGKLTGPPDLGIYFDCAARGRGFYGRAGVDMEAITAQLGNFPLIGMYGGFELATAMGLPHIYTYTGVLLLLRGLS